MEHYEWSVLPDPFMDLLHPDPFVKNNEPNSSFKKWSFQEWCPWETFHCFKLEKEDALNQHVKDDFP